MSFISPRSSSGPSSFTSSVSASDEAADLAFPAGAASARASVGPCRAHQEDSFALGSLPLSTGDVLPVLVVCDGMGGAAGGEVASQGAVSAIIAHLMHVLSGPSVRDVARVLVQAIQVADTLIFETARRDRAVRGMGCTTTAAVIVDGCLLVAQVGDSRAYVLRNGQITQVTRDQTLLQQLIESGQLRPEDAATFEFSNVILQAVGTTGAVMVDLSLCPLAKGDVILLCSDGLHGQVDDAEIAATLDALSPAEAALQLVAKANAAGGIDNVTCLVARLDSTDSRDSSAVRRAMHGDVPRYERYAVPPLADPLMNETCESKDSFRDTEPRMPAVLPTPPMPFAEPERDDSTPDIPMMTGASLGALAPWVLLSVLLVALGLAACARSIW